MKSKPLKNADEQVKKIIYNKVQDCYITGAIPNDFTISKITKIPKKSNAIECTNYRTLSLISHTLTIFLSIIKNRIKSKVETLQFFKHSQVKLTFTKKLILLLSLISLTY